MPDPTTSSPPVGKRRIAINTAAMGLSQVVTVAVSLIFLPLLVRAFGLATYGVFMLSVTVAGYTYLLDLGIGVQVVRMVAERLTGQDGEGVPGVVASAAVLFAMAGVVAAAAMIVVGVVAGVLFRVTPAQADLLRSLLWIGAAYQLWYWPASTARHALGGYQRYGALAWTTIASTTLYAASIVYVLVSGRGPVALTVLNVAAGAAVSLVTMWLLWRSVRRASGRFSPSVSTMRGMLRSGLPVFLVQVAHTVNRQHTDRLILGIVVGPAAVALYEIAAKVSALVSQAGDLVVSAILPVAAGLSVKGERANIRALFVRGAKYTSVLVAPVTVVLLLIAQPFIRAWFGPGFSASVPVAQALLLAQLLVPLYLIGDSILIGMDRFSRWTPWALTLAAVNLVASVLLVLRFGLVGVALGTLLAYVLEFPVYGRMLTRETGVGFVAWLRASMLPTYPLLAVPAVVCLAGLQTGLRTSIPGLAAIGAVAVTAYWAAAWRMSLNGVERGQVRSFVRGFLPSGRIGADGGVS